MKLVQLRTIADPRGQLTVIEGLGFQIKRVYYIHTLANKAVRGGHAHRMLERMMIAPAGRFRVTGEDGSGMKSVVTIDAPTVGLRIPPMTWIELDKFSRNAVCLVLASAEYDLTDYIRERSEFDSLSQSR